MVSAIKYFLLFFLVFRVPVNLCCQVIYSDKELEVFNSVLSYAEKMKLRDSSIQKIVLHVGRQFIGTPYVGGVLDIPEKESLVIDLSRLDCVTFIECTIALSLIIKDNKTAFDDFCNEVKTIRYRNGIMDGYASRLHYFYEWIHDNQNKGFLVNVTSDMGGKIFVKKISCMTGNRSKYPHLKDEQAWIMIKKVEEELSSMNKFYIPKENLEEAENQINDGDLIAIATSIDGLEIAHTGIAVHVNGVLHIMHASSLNKQVEISKLSLLDFVRNKSSYSGIVVARLRN